MSALKLWTGLVLLGLVLSAAPADVSFADTASANVCTPGEDAWEYVDCETECLRNALRSLPGPVACND